MKKRRTKKKTTGGGSFLKKVQRDRSVRAVKARIRKADTARKKLSRQYKAAIKKAAGKLKRKRR